MRKEQDRAQKQLRAHHRAEVEEMERLAAEARAIDVRSRNSVSMQMRLMATVRALLTLLACLLACLLASCFSELHKRQPPDQETSMYQL